jgi:hypothetical protein
VGPIATPGREPVNIVTGEVFLLEVLGKRKLMRVRMEHADGNGTRSSSAVAASAAPSCAMGCEPGSSTSASCMRASSNKKTNTDWRPAAEPPSHPLQAF